MKHYVTALLLLLDPATCANPFRTAPRKPPSKACKTAKNNKGPQCTQDADLVARYGAQLCPNQVAAKFGRLDETFIRTRGLVNFLQPAYSAPVSDNFVTNGQVALTFEQAVSVCVTKCENDPGCDAVHVQERPAGLFKELYDSTGKSDFRCKMISTGLGPGAYLVSYPQEWALSTLVTFVKLPSKVPSFEEVQCTIDGTAAGLQRGVGCTVGQITDPVECGALLTDDWNQFMAPAIGCVAQNGGGDALEACLGCLLTNEDSSISNICPVDKWDATTLFTSPSQCATACLGATCQMPLQMMMLCITGAPVRPEGTVVGLFSGGEINGPDFMCPSVE